MNHFNTVLLNCFFFFAFYWLNQTHDINTDFSTQCFNSVCLSSFKMSTPLDTHWKWYITSTSHIWLYLRSFLNVYYLGARDSNSLVGNSVTNLFAFLWSIFRFYANLMGRVYKNFSPQVYELWTLNDKQTSPQNIETRETSGRPTNS